MLASVKKMIQAVENGRKSAKAGNHSMQVLSDGTIKYFYHWTAICTVNKDGSVKYDNGGWSTPSTHRSISSYAEYYGGDWKKQVNK